MSAADKPAVLFVCVHNAGRSQMAAALMQKHAAGRVDVRSAGSEPADGVNPVVAQVLLERDGIDISRNVPRLLDPRQVERVSVAVTMGCGDACPVFPGVRYLDWDLPDPSFLTLPEVASLRDEIERRVLALLEELLP
jgi:protein-tyrosine-phosphatase